MAIVLTDNKYYTEIADAIREKNGSADTYTPAQMAEAILALSAGGGVLPTGYTLLEYIQASGTQYIDTNFKPNHNSRIVMSASVELKAITALLGCRDAAKTNGFCVFMYSTGKFQSDYGTTQLLNTASNVTISAGHHIFEINKNVLLVDGKAAHTSTTQTFSCSYPAFLMMVNNGGAIQSSANFMVGKLYSCQIYDNGTLVRDFVPCIDPSGVCGLYDLVGNKFYGNAGTGSFVGA